MPHMSQNAGFWVAKFRSMLILVGTRDKDNQIVESENHRFTMFRVFTSWTLLLTSLGREGLMRHPSWSSPYDIFYVNLERMIVSDVTDMVLQESQHYQPTIEEMEMEEPPSTPGIEAFKERQGDHEEAQASEGIEQVRRGSESKVGQVNVRLKEEDISSEESNQAKAD